MQSLGVVKIKDGIYIGDKFAAQDLEFSLLNKVTRVVNCAAAQVPQHWEFFGISYLKFQWSQTSKISEPLQDISQKIFKFIQQCVRNHQGVLIHSERIDNRCVFALLVYMMRKYRWPLKKTVQFLSIKALHVVLNSVYVQQLIRYESLLAKMGLGALTFDWSSHPTSNQTDEQLLRNTYLNCIDLSGQQKSQAVQKKERKIYWNDQIGKQLIQILHNDIALYKKKIYSALSQPAKSILKTSFSKTNKVTRLLSAKPRDKTELPLQRNIKSSLQSRLPFRTNKQLQSRLKQRLPEMKKQKRRLFKRSSTELLEGSKKVINNYMQKNIKRKTLSHGVIKPKLLIS